MERITRADLYAAVERLNRLAGNADFTVEYAYGNPRLHRNNGSVEVSPRLHPYELLTWIHAFMDGLLYAQHNCEEV